jgi:hypothetical protein
MPGVLPRRLECAIDQRVAVGSETTHPNRNMIADTFERGVYQLADAAPGPG